MPILFVHGHQESTVGSAIADTGAALSYISRDLAAPLPLTLREYHGPTIQLADGHQFTTCQSAELSVRLGPVHCHHEFAILPGLPADCLLGLDFLSLQGIMVDAKERCLRFSGFPDLVLPFDGHETRHFVCCAADFELPADWRRGSRSTSPILAKASISANRCATLKLPRRCYWDELWLPTPPLTS